MVRDARMFAIGGGTRRDDAQPHRRSPAADAFKLASLVCRQDSAWDRGAPRLRRGAPNIGMGAISGPRLRRWRNLIADRLLPTRSNWRAYEPRLRVEQRSDTAPPGRSDNDEGGHGGHFGAPFQTAEPSHARLAPQGRAGVSLVTVMSRARLGRLTSSPLSFCYSPPSSTLLLQGACLPHTHTGVGAGLYNQDHDLSLLATLHGAAVLLDAQPAPLVSVVVSAVTPAGVTAPAAPLARPPKSRPAPRLEPLPTLIRSRAGPGGTIAHNSAREASMRGSIIPWCGWPGRTARAGRGAGHRSVASRGGAAAAATGAVSEDDRSAQRAAEASGAAEHTDRRPPAPPAPPAATGGTPPRERRDHRPAARDRHPAPRPSRKRRAARRALADGARSAQPSPAVLPLSAARRRAAPVRHGRHRRLRRQPHAAQRAEGPGRHLLGSARIASFLARSS